MRGFVISTLLLSAVLASVYAFYTGRIVIPDKWDSWAPFSIVERLTVSVA
ncbi:MAG: hypothetical protein V4637_12760 [Pseudomonadota bacterium]